MGNVMSIYKEYQNWRTLTKSQTSRLNDLSDQIKKLYVEVDKIKVDVKMLYSNNV